MFAPRSCLYLYSQSHTRAHEWTHLSTRPTHVPCRARCSNWRAHAVHPARSRTSRRHATAPMAHSSCARISQGCAPLPTVDVRVLTSSFLRGIAVRTPESGARDCPSPVHVEVREVRVRTPMFVRTLRAAADASSPRSVFVLRHGALLVFWKQVTSILTTYSVSCRRSDLST